MCAAVNAAASVYLELRSLWLGFWSGCVFLSDHWRSEEKQTSGWNPRMATESRGAKPKSRSVEMDLLLLRMSWISAVSCLGFSLQLVLMESLFFFLFIFFFLSSVTTSRRDDWERLTLSPAAWLYSGGACYTLLIEGQFSFSHPGSYDMIHWCIQPISSRIWESIGWIVTAMTSSSCTHLLLFFLRSCIRKRLNYSGPWHVTLFDGKGLRCLMFLMQST